MKTFEYRDEIENVFAYMQEQYKEAVRYFNACEPAAKGKVNKIYTSIEVDEEANILIMEFEKEEIDEEENK